MASVAAIKESIRVEEVIGRVVTLKAHGPWLIGRCPFHADQHPSLVVWPGTQTWKCMTCSEMRDDVIGFVAQWRHCSTAEALATLTEELPKRPVRALRDADMTPVAALRDRHDAYDTALMTWGLSLLHDTALRERGLTSRTIRQAGFATLVPGRAPATPTAPHIPGFFRQNGQWGARGPAGLAIPVRDLVGRIQAIHIRADDVSHGKYRWFSSPGMPDGAASGAPVHVARGVNDALWITEGPLKAIVAQQFLRHTVLGVAGITAWHTVPGIVRVIAPQRVILAFDQDPDPATATAVAQQSARLAALLTSAGHSVVQAVWEGPKGLDDALVAGARMQFSPVQA